MKKFNGEKFLKATKEFGKVLEKRFEEKVNRKEFEELRARVEIIEEALAIKKFKK
jgi:hypothetical protein